MPLFAMLLPGKAMPLILTDRGGKCTLQAGFGCKLLVESRSTHSRVQCNRENIMKNDRKPDDPERRFRGTSDAARQQCLPGRSGLRVEICCAGRGNMPTRGSFTARIPPRIHSGTRFILEEPLKKSAAALSGSFAPTCRFETKSLADRSRDFIRASLESVKKLEELFIAPAARQILHETAQRACARCACAMHTGFLIQYLNQESVSERGG